MKCWRVTLCVWAMAAGCGTPDLIRGELRRVGPPKEFPTYRGAGFTAEIRARWVSGGLSYRIVVRADSGYAAVIGQQGTVRLYDEAGLVTAYFRLTLAPEHESETLRKYGPLDFPITFAGIAVCRGEAEAVCSEEGVALAQRWELALDRPPVGTAIKAR